MVLSNKALEHSFRPADMRFDQQLSNLLLLWPPGTIAQSRFSEPNFLKLHMYSRSYSVNLLSLTHSIVPRALRVHL